MAPSIDPPGTPAIVSRAAVHPLNARTLVKHAGRVHIPTYERSGLTPSVVHISVGGFHRAHQLVYFDELAERSVTSGWGVVGVGLHTPTMRDALAPQDHLYTVVERDAGAESARIVGAMVDYVFAPDAPEKVLSLLADPRTRLVTMTITGTTYRVDPRTGTYDPDEEALADLTHPHRPRSVFGHVVEGLDRRRRAGVPPFTVLSCDNLLANGAAARAAVIGFARRRDEVLARWIADHVAFPNSMVDRITPSTGPEEREDVARTFGVDDRWPVITEPFSQWVVEDTFCHGRPPLDRVGVRFVRDVHDHEVMKTRLLNAAHCALGYLGRLAGHGRTDEVMADDVFRAYVTRLMGDEIAPQLVEPEGVDLGEYQESLLHRFANPAIGDRLERLCRRGSTKMPDYLLPSAHQAVAEGRPFDLLALAVAGWFRYLLGRDDAGREIQVEDPQAERLTELARSGGPDPRRLLARRDLFGGLGDCPAFVGAVAGHLRQFELDGVRATVAARLASPDPQRPGTTPPFPGGCPRPATA
ncbi:mannitol dehydrogenase family protein [Geodermatophilus sp. SYSU D00815]